MDLSSKKMAEQFDKVKQQFSGIDFKKTATVDRAVVHQVLWGLGFTDKQTDRVLRSSGNSGQNVDYVAFLDWLFLDSQEEHRRKELLRGVTLFQALGDKDIEYLAKVLDVRFFSAGEQIIAKDEEGLDCFIVDTGEAFAQITIDGSPKEVKQYGQGGFFGERALFKSEPRAADIIARTDLRALRLSRDHFTAMIDDRNKKENLIKGTKLFENMTDEQVMKLGSALERRCFSAGEDIVLQGEEGHHFYILEKGECAASIKFADGQSQTVKQYLPGELFGEKALIEKAPRGATITATTDAAVLMLSRDDFESKFGPLSQLKVEQHLADPRTLIADFFASGDTRGPMGSITAKDLQADENEPTQWFAVYRPCSRDAIAKMLGKVGVGKGLNVKGKSSKKNRLSGFVPFIQISDNDHKAEIEESPDHARTCIYYRNLACRDTALEALHNVLQQIRASIKMEKAEINLLNDYPDTPGLDVPEPLLREAYIMRPDLSPSVGWETGRESEPAFMDMNLHAVRGRNDPKVVVFQFDTSDSMNPLGLLVAYSESSVNPVVSDLDTFTIGSKGMSYEPLPDKQRELIKWELDNASDVIGMPGSKTWTSRWLQVLKEGAAKGFHPEIPQFGFGDPVSVSIIKDLVDVTAHCGAVRHGAECFNFYFPQELDDDFLVVWDGFSDPPWRQHSELELREFLLARAAEGFVFPINPVWPIRDPGWYEVLQALRDSDKGKEALENWLTQESLEKIEEMHEKFPEGFQIAQNASQAVRGSVMTSAQDLTGEEMADFVRHEVRKVVRARWRKVRACLLWTARLSIMRKRNEEKVKVEAETTATEERIQDAVTGG